MTDQQDLNETTDENYFSMQDFNLRIKRTGWSGLSKISESIEKLQNTVYFLFAQVLMFKPQDNEITKLQTGQN